MEVRLPSCRCAFSRCVVAHCCCRPYRGAVDGSPHVDQGQRQVQRRETGDGLVSHHQEGEPSRAWSVNDWWETSVLLPPQTKSRSNESNTRTQSRNPPNEGPKGGGTAVATLDRKRTGRAILEMHNTEAYRVGRGNISVWPVDVCSASSSCRKHSRGAKKKKKDGGKGADDMHGKCRS